MDRTRQDQLADWEQMRKRELRMDLEAHWSRNLPGLILFGSIWFAVDFFRPPFLGVIRFGVAFCCGIYLTGKIITWLRLWAAYIERRLLEIEARVLNEYPGYYQEGDQHSFDENPLFQKLQTIEDRLTELRRKYDS
jgi:hypothetical protein